MNKMTVIQLLNKIANGEEVPKKIEYEGKIYHIDELEHFYVNDDREALLEYIFDYLNDYDALMSEVETLEEPKGMPERVLNAEVFDVPKLNNMELSNIALTNKEDIKIIKDTLNEVLDYLKSKGDE